MATATDRVFSFIHKELAAANRLFRRSVVVDLLFRYYEDENGIFRDTRDKGAAYTLEELCARQNAGRGGL